MSVWKLVAERFLNVVCTLRRCALGSLRQTYQALPVLFVVMASVLVLSASVSLILAAILAAKLVQLVGIETTIQILKGVLEVFLATLGFLVAALRYYAEMRQKRRS